MAAVCTRTAYATDLPRRDVLAAPVSPRTWSPASGCAANRRRALVSSPAPARVAPYCQMRTTIAARPADCEISAPIGTSGWLGPLICRLRATIRPVFLPGAPLAHLPGLDGWALTDVQRRIPCHNIGSASSDRCRTGWRRGEHFAFGRLTLAIARCFSRSADRTPMTWSAKPAAIFPAIVPFAILATAQPSTAISNSTRRPSRPLARSGLAFSTRWAARSVQVGRSRRLRLATTATGRAHAAGPGLLRDAHRHLHARGNLGGRGRATGRTGRAGRHRAGDHADCRVCRPIRLELRSGQFVCSLATGMARPTTLRRFIDEAHRHADRRDPGRGL